MTVNFSYDAASQQKTLANPRDEVTTYTYNATGRTTQKELGNGSRATYAYDPAGRQILVHNVDSGDLTLSRFDYQFDAAGNKTSVIESSGDRVTWTYDNTYQLNNEQRDGVHAYNTTYQYDPVGDRTLELDGAARTTYTYDAANQLETVVDTSGTTSYTYDADGNRLKKDAPAAVIDYTWNEDDRLIQVETVSDTLDFTYNADGKRVRRQSGSETKKFLYDFQKLLQEMDGGDTTTHEYTFSVEDEYAELVSEYDGTNTGYYDYDGVGSADALREPAAENEYTYKAFGHVENETGGIANPFTFIGGSSYYRDSEIDLYLLGARYYDADRGRFISEDPLGFDAGDENLYRYVGNNPLNAIDPSGELAPAAAIVAGAVIGCLADLAIDQAIVAVTEQRLLTWCEAIADCIGGAVSGVVFELTLNFWTTAAAGAIATEIAFQLCTGGCFDPAQLIRAILVALATAGVLRAISKRIGALSRRDELAPGEKRLLPRGGKTKSIFDLETPRSTPEQMRRTVRKLDSAQGGIRLTPDEINGLTENARLVARNYWKGKASGTPRTVQSLENQLNRPRWRFLDQAREACRILAEIAKDAGIPF